MGPRRNIRLTLEYDGTRYHGWQRQKNALSIQAVIETALARITGEAVRLTGSGRTDAGVHALGQVANFLTTSPVPRRALPAWPQFPPAHGHRGSAGGGSAPSIFTPASPPWPRLTSTASSTGRCARP